jgi:hypothetical protein
VFAAAVGVEAGLKADVRAVVIGKNPAAAVAEELGARQGVLLRVPVRVPLQREMLEAVGRVAAGAAGRRRCAADVHRW